ncbi:MAG TPA: cupin domain-containing protein [archaeon]|nr:cupin domain-containing protein [archaeon]
MKIYSHSDSEISVIASGRKDFSNGADRIFHWHDGFDEFYITESGCGLLSNDDISYVMKPDAIIKTEAGEKHRIANVYGEKDKFRYFTVKVPCKEERMVIG